jgi:microcystin-dependent protein
MTEPFLAEIALVAFSYAPAGWALCNGQLMPISQNTALYSLLGTTYGGDGRITFALPNLQGSIPVQPGQAGGENRYLGEQGGTASTVLNAAEMPIHTHPFKATAALGTSTKPDGRSIAVPRYGRLTENWFAQPGGAGQTIMDYSAAAAPAGAGNAHNNLPPYLALNFVIALQGVFPQRP